MTLTKSRNWTSPTWGRLIENQCQSCSSQKFLEKAGSQLLAISQLNMTLQRMMKRITNHSLRPMSVSNTSRRSTSKLLGKFNSTMNNKNRPAKRQSIPPSLKSSQLLRERRAFSKIGIRPYISTIRNQLKKRKSMAEGKAKWLICSKTLMVKSFRTPVLKGPANLSRKLNLERVFLEM